MSYRASKFVAELTGLTPSEKAVALILAFRADKDSGEAYPAMARIAREAGFKTERGARMVVRRLEKKNVILAASPKTGGRGRDKATVYRLNVDLLSEDKTRNACSAFSDQKPGTHVPQTRNSSSQNPERTFPKPGTPVPPNSKELKRSESECENESHPHAFNSRDDGEEISSSKPKSEPVNIQPPSKLQTAYGTLSWAREQAEGWPDETIALTSIADIPLKGDRRFDSSPKLRATVRRCLERNVPWEKIVEAAEQYAPRISDKDQLPGLTLADNLENVLWLSAAQPPPSGK